MSKESEKENKDIISAKKKFFLVIRNNDLENASLLMKKLNKPGIREKVFFELNQFGRTYYLTPLMFCALTCKKVEDFTKFFELFTKSKFCKIDDIDRSEYGLDCLHISLMRGNLLIAEFLKEKGASCETKCSMGHNVLMHCSMFSKVSSVKWILNNTKNDINARCKSHENTPLILACLGKRFSTVKHLVSVGADLKISNKLGTTPMLMASFTGDVELLKFLLEKGSSIKEVNIGGNNALMLACKSGKLKIVKWLLENTKIDLEDKNKKGETCYMIAKKKKNHDIITYITKLKKKKEDMEKVVFDYRKDVNLDSLVDNIMFEMSNDERPKKKWERHELDRKNVTIKRQLACGSFGVVCKGVLKIGEGEIDVAIKQQVLKNEEIENLKKEIDIMSELKHDNIIKYFGVC